MSEKIRSLNEGILAYRRDGLRRTGYTLGVEQRMGEYDTELSRIVEELNRAAPSQKPVTAMPASMASLDQLLDFAAKRNASDILLVAGVPPVLRVNGALAPSSGAALEAEIIRSMVLPLLAPSQLDELQKRRSVDFGFIREGLGRFRVNLHHQRGTLAASIRLLPSRIPSLESLHLPPSLGKLVDRRQGLVLITGPTGCGKTSTLAALIDIVNSRRAAHVVTIEDPVEYQHANRAAIIEQIEIGRDTPDFSGTLRSIVRQTPDVIQIGEMRDPETMATALTAAETGHLVLSTLHTNDTIQAVSRILDSFPAANQPQIRQQISLALLAVIAQQLVPGADGHTRWPATEIMIATDAVRALIRKGDDHQLRSQISVGRADGMMTMEQSLAELVRASRITRDTAFAHCFRTEDLHRYLGA
jgi:twitching motility protein PilT